MKKKILSVLTAATMILSSFTAVHCEDDIKVLLDGQEIAFDVPPQIINERTLVPMRAIFEALGAKVDWDGDVQTVTASASELNTTVTMQIDNVTMTKNADGGESTPITLDVPPQIIGERTLVPVRAIAESFDCNVDWNGDTRTVVITTSNAQPTVVPTTAPSEYSLEYDDTNERLAHYIRNFEITNVSKNADGNYDISYKLETFLEGRGTVATLFNCLDENGKVIDTFGETFIGTDYTWSPQTSSAVISGKTVKIELSVK